MQPWIRPDAHDWRKFTLGELEHRGDIGSISGKVISHKDIDRCPVTIRSTREVHFDGLLRELWCVHVR